VRESREKELFRVREREIFPLSRETEIGAKKTTSVRILAGSLIDCTFDGRKLICDYGKKAGDF
jgi:hypothetical protein